MKPTALKPHHHAIVLAACLVPSHAAVVVNHTTTINAGFTVSNSDLLQTHLASASFIGSFVHEGNIGVAAFNNGIYGSQGNQGGMNPGQFEAATADAANTATFILDAGSGFGYDLSSLDVFAGWDQYRGGQQYGLYYDTVAAPGSYVFLTSVFNNAVGANSSQNVNTRAQITDSSGTLAANVRSLRFVFGGGLTFGFAGYREIDAFGTASIPEPTTGVLTLLPAAALLRRRRSSP